MAKVTAILAFLSRRKREMSAVARLAGRGVDMMKRVLSQSCKIRRMLTTNRLPDFIQIPKIVTFRLGEHGSFGGRRASFTAGSATAAVLAKPCPKPPLSWS